MIEKVFEILTLVINIVKTDDWRLTGQEDYLLFAKLKEIIPSDYFKTLDNPEYFHEHCEFCMTKPEDNKVHVSKAKLLDQITYGTFLNRYSFSSVVKAGCV